MTNVEAIKAKLLAKQYYFGDRRLINPDGPETAAVIDALAAENERLREKLMRYDQMHTQISSAALTGKAEQ